MKKTILTEKDYNNFYKLVLFGNIDDPLYTSVKTAYRDFCRTVKGFANHPEHDYIYNLCCEVIYSRIKELLDCTSMDQNTFDIIHKRFCDRLICFFNDGMLTYGQAQKWINMTIKYMSMLEPKKMTVIYEYCHVPIDNYILKATNYKLTKAWSKLDSYEEYINFQKYFRKQYDGIPLDVEFNMWIKESKK